MGCDRCRRRDELDYCNLDDREKHLLMFIRDGCGHEMLSYIQIIPDGFRRRFRGEIPGEIKLETRNGRSFTVGVAKYPDKLVLRAGWGAFVETYDLKKDDSVVFTYNGDSQFDVVIFDQSGLEKALSVVADDAPPSPHVQERHRGATETLDRSHGHPRPMEMQSPTQDVNRSQRNHQLMETQSPNEDVNCSQGNPRLMQMQLPTEDVNRSQGNPQRMQMQSPSMERHILLQRDNSSQRNRRDSLSSEDRDHEVKALPGYTTLRKNSLTSIQKEAVETKIQFIDSKNPIFVVVMRKTNVTGRFTISISKKYADKYLGDEVRSIWLERLGEMWRVRLGRRPQDKRIVGGWPKFVRNNDVQTGDICLFELLKHRKACTMKVHIIRAKQLVDQHAISAVAADYCGRGSVFC